MDITFRLYNSLTRQVEEVVPSTSNHLRMYACGPTVYSHAHIGNFRSFLTSDLIVRTARSIGWDVTYVSNITDVGHLTEDDVADSSGDDKMVKALKSSDGSFANIWDLADFYTKTLVDDWTELKLLEPQVRPRATQHIREQIQAVEALVEKGHAYETSRGVYFSVESFPSYGTLSGNTDAAGLDTLVRSTVNDPEKRDSRDFALWKKDDKHLMQWYSPWGWGFPGWHIECSVMANKYLGVSFDLHAGGEDLRFPHHECEIAQSESLTGEQFARLWVHTRFLQVEGAKMSKRSGNYYTVRDILDGAGPVEAPVAAEALRYALISGHYRKPFNFTAKHLLDSAKAIEKLGSICSELAGVAVPEGPTDSDLGVALSASFGRCQAAMLDDLNVPAALAAVHEGLGAIGRHSGVEPEATAWWLERVDQLLGIVPPPVRSGSLEESDSGETVPESIRELALRRDEARSARNWSLADELRFEIERSGFVVVDTPEGSSVSPTK